MKKNGLLVIFLRFFENSSEELGMGNTRYVLGIPCYGEPLGLICLTAVAGYLNF
jgi:hypothetical protein